MTRYDLAAAALAVLVAVSLGLLASDHVRCADKVDVAQHTAVQYAYEAYPMWASEHRSAICPRALAELNEYMNNEDTKDPWGHDYVMSCDGDPRHFAIGSGGPDGIFGTADDVLSR